MTFKRKVILAALMVTLLICFGAAFVDPPGAPPGNYPGVGYMFIMMIGVGFEVFCLLLTGIIYRTLKADAEVVGADKVSENKQQSNAFFLAAGLVLLVGTSLCFGGAAIVYG